MRVGRPLAVASAMLLAQAGCASTSYTPRNDGQIWRTVDGGFDTLAKDGARYPANYDGLKQAVAGNSEAEEHARRYNTGMNLSFAEYFAGLGAVVGGFILASHPSDMGVEQPISQGRQVGGVLLVFAGFGGMFVSLFQSFAARTHFQDAINVYNDAVPRCLAPPIGAPATPVRPVPPGSPEVTPLLPAPAPDVGPPAN
jgi:hypothetical protein